MGLLWLSSCSCNMWDEQNGGNFNEMKNTAKTYLAIILLSSQMLVSHGDPALR